MNRGRKSLLLIRIWAVLVLLALWVGSGLAGAPRNVILMIGDGMGYNTVRAAAYYQGASLVFEGFPVKYAVSTYPRGGGYDPQKAWASFDYVKSGATDSAAAATAMATGVKTSNGRVNMTEQHRKLKTIVDLFSEQGKATGVVTSVPFSHTTPACMAAHNGNRNHYAAIAREMLAGPLDVIMGAGHPDYDDNGQRVTIKMPGAYKYVGGPFLWAALKNGTSGWQLIETKRDFENLAEGKGLKPGAKVLGLARVRHTLQQKRGWDTLAPPYAEPLNSSVPTLAVMTQGALRVLEQNPRGFFLMVEGGAIDWAAHGQQLGRLIEEELDFAQAVAAAVEWIETHGGWEKTLLIVTSDHETGHLWGPGSGLPHTFAPLVNKGPGRLPGAKFFFAEHTNALVPLYAKGAGAELFAGYANEVDPKRGPYLDNTEIFQVMLGKAAWRIPVKKGKGLEKSAATWKEAVGF
ncbi:MAG: alkaline phosphatase [Deltaproteobacteria bacterium]|nr:alkaline phosphatase [Deltaproteobacteria bacterium]